MPNELSRRYSQNSQKSSIENNKLDLSVSAYQDSKSNINRENFRKKLLSGNVENDNLTNDNHYKNCNEHEKSTQVIKQFEEKTRYWQEIAQQSNNPHATVGEILNLLQNKKEPQVSAMNEESSKIPIHDLSRSQ